MRFLSTCCCCCCCLLLSRRKFWTLLRDDSIFVDWQRLKVQENVDEVRGRGGSSRGGWQPAAAGAVGSRGAVGSSCNSSRTSHPPCFLCQLCSRQVQCGH
jgi:hypothetical protein